MTNTVTYTVELTESNAPLIDKLNTLLLPGYGGGTTEAPAKKEKPAKKETGLSLTAVKKVVKAAKADHGEDHIRACAAIVDVEDSDLSLAKLISAVNPDDYQAFVDALNTAPVESDEDDDLEDEDDDLEDEDDEEISVDDVKEAVKAFAKSESKDAAKKAMKKCGAASLKDVADLSAAKLTKLYDLVS